MIHAVKLRPRALAEIARARRAYGRIDHGEASSVFARARRTLSCSRCSRNAQIPGAGLGSSLLSWHRPAPTASCRRRWEAYYTFDPPRVNYTVEGAMVVMPLTFPTEMCSGFGFFFPGDAQADCTDGQWPEGF